jgi:hypothetical protein
MSAVPRDRGAAGPGDPPGGHQGGHRRDEPQGWSASRIGCAHLVISAVFNEAVRNKKLPESPCTDIPVSGVVYTADFVPPADEELKALAAGLPPDWTATVLRVRGD